MTNTVVSGDGWRTSEHLGAKVPWDALHMRVEIRLLRTATSDTQVVAAAEAVVTEL